jgi:prostaglandin-E synthase 1
MSILPRLVRRLIRNMDNAANIYALCAAILGAQLILIAFWTGTVRVKRKIYVNPEDAKINKADHGEADHADVLRVKRAHQNALENAVPFFAVGALYAATNPSKTAALLYMGTFTVVRVLHTFFYLGGKQPFRTLCFAIGALATLGMAQHVIRAAL